MSSNNEIDEHDHMDARALEYQEDAEHHKLLSTQACKHQHQYEEDEHCDEEGMKGYELRTSKSFLPHNGEKGKMSPSLNLELVA